MSIVTKTGDRGKTSLFRGVRVSKSDVHVEAYGTLDELTSFLGWITAVKIASQDAFFITHVQKNLHKIMAVVSGSTATDLSSLNKHIIAMEKRIEELEIALPKLTAFILPQGGEIASRFHIARTVTRRAERLLVHVFETDTVVTDDNKYIILAFINRLSDTLFMLARFYAINETTLKA